MPVLSKNSETAVIRTFLYLSGFQRHNRQKAFNIKHFRRIRSIPKLPSKIAKQPLTHKTRNPSCDSFARGFKSHPLRQKPGSHQAFRAFILLQKASFKSTKCIFLTHTVFYERGFEKHFQALYNANRYNRGWKHSDKKRKKYLSTYSTRSIAW